MEELLKVLNDAVLNFQKFMAQLSNAAAYANNITREAEAKLAELSKRETALDAEKADISVREEAVKKIEDIEKLKIDAGIIMNEAKASMSRLQQAKDTFKAYQKEQLALIAGEKQKNTDASEMNKKEGVALKKEREKLVKEKEELVQRIISNLSKQD